MTLAMAAVLAGCGGVLVLRLVAAVAVAATAAAAVTVNLAGYPDELPKYEGEV